MSWEESPSPLTAPECAGETCRAPELISKAEWGKLRVRIDRVNFPPLMAMGTFFRANCSLGWLGANIPWGVAISSQFR